MKFTKLFILVLILFATLVKTIFTSYFTTSAKMGLAIKIDKWSRWIFPFMLILVAF